MGELCCSEKGELSRTKTVDPGPCHHLKLRISVRRSGKGSTLIVVCCLPGYGQKRALEKVALAQMRFPLQELCIYGAGIRVDSGVGPAHTALVCLAGYFRAVIVTAADGLLVRRFFMVRTGHLATSFQQFPLRILGFRLGIVHRLAQILVVRIQTRTRTENR